MAPAPGNNYRFKRSEPTLPHTSQTRDFSVVCVRQKYQNSGCCVLLLLDFQYGLLELHGGKNQGDNLKDSSCQTARGEQLVVLVVQLFPQTKKWNKPDKAVHIKNGPIKSAKLDRINKKSLIILQKHVPNMSAKIRLSVICSCHRPVKYWKNREDIMKWGRFQEWLSASFEINFFPVLLPGALICQWLFSHHLL